MRSNFICIFFIGIVFDAVWLQRLCFFLSDFFEFGRFQKIFSFSKKIIIKTNLLCCPAPFLQYRFCGSAFLPHLYGFAFLVPFFCCIYSASLFRFRIFAAASLLWFRFLPLFPVHVSLVLFLRLCLSCFFLVFFFCCVSFAALFLLCFPERKKS